MRAGLVCVSLLLGVMAAAAAPDPPTLSNQWLTLEFEAATLGLERIVHNRANLNFLRGGSTPFWQATLVTRLGPVTVNGSSPCKNRRWTAGPGLLLLSWEDIEVPMSGGARVSVAVHVELGATVRFAKFLPAVAVTQGDVGLWEFAFLLPGVASDAVRDDVLFTPEGFGRFHTGRLWPHPTQEGVSDYGSAYPSWKAAMQWMGYYRAQGAASDDPGLYVAAHDPRGNTKELRWTVQRRTNSSTPSIIFTPENAGSSLAKMDIVPSLGAPGYSFSYPFVVGVFTGDWWDAAQLYRTWCLAECQWIKAAGPLRTRPDVPAWLIEMPLWINTGWQYHDVFSRTQGDPAVVRERVPQIVRRFGNVTVGLHWYEWHEALFDTAYPEYFPVRPGFAETVKYLRSLGVRVAPYVNGRIMDVGTGTWSRDRAIDWAAKGVERKLDNQDLSIYKETYGSGATFAVMCPHTQYWQDTYASVLGRLVHEYGTDGAYVDQVSSSAPRKCWDPAHKHTGGGGDHWARGYSEMISKAWKKTGNDAMIVTENNAEPWLSGFNNHLAIYAYNSNYTEKGWGALVPAFQAVYGGYFLSFGAAFLVSDLTVNPDVFATKCAAQFVAGSQLGWFSLGGTLDNPPMGLHDLLLSPKYDPEIAYLRKLIAFRAHAVQYFAHGRRARNLVLNNADAALAAAHASASVVRSAVPLLEEDGERRGVRISGYGDLAFDPVQHAAYVMEDPDTREHSLLLILTAVRRNDPPRKLSFHINLTRYGVSHPDPRRTQWTLQQVLQDGSVMPLGTFKGTAVDYTVAVQSRDVVMLRVVHAGSA